MRGIPRHGQSARWRLRLGVAVVVGAPRRLVNQWAADHCHTLAGGQPIVALDMYKHSYHIDYGAKVATCVDTSMNAMRAGALPIGCLHSVPRQRELSC